MPAGMTVYNDWGTVQIDENWATLAHRTTLTLNVDQAHEFTFSVRGSVSVIADSPMVCWRSGAPVALARSSQGGGAWTFTFYSRTPTWVVLYVFDRPAFLPQNIGLEVFDAAGRKTFGSVGKPMKLRAAIPVGPMTLSDITLADHPFVWDGLPAGTFAVGLSDPGMGLVQTYQGDYEFSATVQAGAVPRANGASVHWVPITGNIPGSGSDYFPPQTLLLVDVAGL